MQAAFRYGRSEATRTHRLPLPHNGGSPRLRGRWQRLHAECPNAAFPARLCYALTQPLA